MGDAAGKRVEGVSVHSTCMESGGESLEVSICAEACVQLRYIGHPVAMVGISVGGGGTFVILVDGTNPN